MADGKERSPWPVTMLDHADGKDTPVLLRALIGTEPPKKLRQEKLRLHMVTSTELSPDEATFLKDFKGAPTCTGKSST